MVGIDKGELHLAFKTTVPFLTIYQNLADSVGTWQKWPPLVRRQPEIGHTTGTFIVWQINRVNRGVVRGILIKVPCGASLKRSCFQNCLATSSTRDGCRREPKRWLPAPRRWNSLLCLLQGAPLPYNLTHFHPSAPHAGARGARNRAMSITISLNICCDTATAASGNLT